MSISLNNPNQLAFSTQCLPGSPAEQKEKERIEEFLRCKALRKEEEDREKPELILLRQQKQLAASQAFKERMHRSKVASAYQTGYRRP